MDKLKPCPFCKGEIILTYEENRIYKYHCQKCKTSTYRKDKSYTDAIAAWNRRPAPHKYTVEELRGLDGNPVYILFGDGTHGWAILEWESEDILLLLPADRPDWNEEPNIDSYNLECCSFDPTSHFGLHVLGWVAYDRKPEEEI